MQFVIFLTFVYALLSTYASSSDTAKNETLKPLKLPENLENINPEDKVLAAQRLLQSLGIGFSFEKTKEVENSTLYKLWNKNLQNETSNNKTSKNNKIGTDINGVLRLNNVNDIPCESKCVIENNNFINFLKSKIQKVISLGQKQNIAAVFELSVGENNYQCKPNATGDGIDCKCKTTVQIKVNEKLQNIFNSYLNGVDGDPKKVDNFLNSTNNNSSIKVSSSPKESNNNNSFTKVGDKLNKIDQTTTAYENLSRINEMSTEANNVERLKYNDQQVTLPFPMQPKKSHLFWRKLCGLFIILHFVPPMIPFYIFWWIFLS